jgi:hypothetical protein
MCFVFTGKNSLSEFEETVDLNKEFATSTVIEVGRHPFAQMEENPDMHRKSNLYGKTTEEQRQLDNRRRLEVIYILLDMKHFICVVLILTCSSLLYAHLHKILKQRIPHLFNLKMLKHKEKRNTSNCVFGLCQIINEN